MQLSASRLLGVVCLTVSASVSAFPVNITYGVIADGYITSGEPNRNFGSVETLQIKNDSISSPYLRKTYLGFSITSLPTSPLISASLTLNFVLGAGVNPAPNSVWAFEVWGLTQSAGGWSENTITWNNAPGNDIGGSGFLPEKTYMIGTFSTTGTGLGEISVPLDKLALSSLLTSDTDGVLSLLIRRTTTATQGGTNYVHGISAREAADGNEDPTAAKLLVSYDNAVPVPSVLALLLVGIGILPFRRRLATNIGGF